MSKKSKPQPAQTAPEPPETEWPQTGGSYVRDEQTGVLTQQNGVAGGIANINEQSEGANHGT